MIRKIIHIDTEKCNGCRLCASACQEGAIGIVDGKATLLREDYCDGLGNCLPVCPTDAISFVEREAAAFDEEAVKKAMEQNAASNGAFMQTEQGQQIETTGGHAAAGEMAQHSCPGSMAKRLLQKVGLEKRPAGGGCPGSMARTLSHETHTETSLHREEAASRLQQWPVQIKLVPVHAPYFDGARLLIAADCTAYAYASFHEDFIKGRITLIGCPKLDDVDYSEKLTEIIRDNDIKNVTIVRMEVPCCGGLERATVEALKASGKMIPWQVVTISTDGRILED